jgi:hypothetical protein
MPKGRSHGVIEEDAATKAIVEPTKAIAPARPLSWALFRRNLAAVLRGMARDQFLIVGTREGRGDRNYYVQFAQGGLRGFRAEAVANVNLAGSNSLSPAQEAKMTELGWQWPAPEDENDPNFSRQWPQNTPFDQVADLAVKTLRDVYRVSAPAELGYRAFSKAGGAYALPRLGIHLQPPRRSSTETRPSVASTVELRSLMEAAIKRLVGKNKIERDDQGDIPIRLGNAMVFVRLIAAEPPFVRIFAPVVWGIPESAELLSAINQANLQIPFGRLVWTGREVMADLHESAVGISLDDIAFGAFQVGTVADRFDDVFQAQFGGNTMFGTPQPPKSPQGTTKGIGFRAPSISAGKS